MGSSFGSERTRQPGLPSRARRGINHSLVFNCPVGVSQILILCLPAPIKRCGYYRKSVTRAADNPSRRPHGIVYLLQSSSGGKRCISGDRVGAVFAPLRTPLFPLWSGLPETPASARPLFQHLIAQSRWCHRLAARPFASGGDPKAAMAAAGETPDFASLYRRQTEHRRNRNG
jgi:hypothetical protein